jgi:hypothetical protein
MRRFAAFDVKFLRTWRERVLARRTSRDLLRAYREIQAAQPETDAVARYRQVIARQMGTDESGVRRILERAEQSFASWPVERPLTFRDVVEYLVVHVCLNAEPAAPGIRSPLARIIAEEIPVDL